MAEIFSPSPVSTYLCSMIGVINNVLNGWSWETDISPLCSSADLVPILREIRGKKCSILKWNICTMFFFTFFFFLSFNNWSKHSIAYTASSVLALGLGCHFVICLFDFDQTGQCLGVNFKVTH